tara:strand:+ start:2147 stop:2407 length:261 start_codon:yes stop_codon:yes gene_type:complete
MNNNFNLQIKIDKIENKLNNIENLLNKLLEKNFNNTQHLNNSIFEDDIVIDNDDILFKSIPNMPLLRRMPAFNNQDNFDNALNSPN